MIPGSAFSTDPSPSRGERMRHEGSPLKAQPTGGRGQTLIIVARDRPDLWRALTRQFAADGDIVILLDRRQGERRQSAQPTAPDRRGSDRRSMPRIEEDIRYRQYVIVRRRRRGLEG